MARFSRMLVVTIGLGALLLATNAFAQPAAAGKSGSANESGMKVDGSGPSYTVEFIDDPLNALSDGVVMPRIVVRPGPVRVMLLRPRTSFVSEMLKSVESM